MLSAICNEDQKLTLKARVSEGLLNYDFTKDLLLYWMTPSLISPPEGCFKDCLSVESFEAFKNITMAMLEREQFPCCKGMGDKKSKNFALIHGSKFTLNILKERIKFYHAEADEPEADEYELNSAIR